MQTMSRLRPGAGGPILRAEKREKSFIGTRGAQMSKSRRQENTAGICEHLKDLTQADFPPPKTPNACEECLKEGTQWVSLRECKICGHVGCCDSSPGRH